MAWKGNRSPFCRLCQRCDGIDTHDFVIWQFKKYRRIFQAVYKGNLTVHNAVWLIPVLCDHYSQVFVYGGFFISQSHFICASIGESLNRVFMTAWFTNWDARRLTLSTVAWDISYRSMRLKLTYSYSWVGLWLIIAILYLLCYSKRLLKQESNVC